MDGLITAFEAINDTRSSQGKRHSLTHIIVMFVVAMLHGYFDMEEIHDFCKSKEDWFDARLDLWAGIPCRTTFGNVLSSIPAEVFMGTFIGWVNQVSKEQRSHIIIDGKGIKAAAEKVAGQRTPYLVSAFLAGAGISIGQIKVGKKTNEQKAIPDLLRALDLKEATVTIDAAGTTEEIMDLIKQGGGEFILPIKGNQPKAFEAIEDFFDLYDKEVMESVDRRLETEFKLSGFTNSGLDVYVERECAHGRDTERIYAKCHVMKGIPERFRDVQSVVKVTSFTSQRGICERYFVDSLDRPVEEVAKIIRGHWGIENNLHWVLDMYFNEDHCRVRQENALENMAQLRKICYNIIQLDTRFDRVNKNGNLVKMSFKRKMNHYSLYPEMFEELLDSFLPGLSSKLINDLLTHEI